MSIENQVIVLAIQAQVPVLLWGKPGIAKTARVRQIAGWLEQLKASGHSWAHYTLIGSIREPSDILGLPWIKEGVVTIAKPEWVDYLKNGGLLIEDEINSNSPAMMAANLRVVAEQVVGDTQLNDVSIAATANPMEMGTGCWPMGLSMLNRFMHLDIKESVAEFKEYLDSGGRLNPKASSGMGALTLAPSNWMQDYLPSVYSILGRFLVAKPDLLCVVPREEEDEAKKRAWPSYRTWDMAAVMVAIAEATQSSDAVMSLAVTGLVGSGAAKEFFHYYKVADLLDGVEMIKCAIRGGELPPLPSAPDKLGALADSIVEALATYNSSAVAWGAAWNVLMAALGPDYVNLPVIAVQVLKLVQSKPESLPFPPEAILLAEKLRKTTL